MSTAYRPIHPGEILAEEFLIPLGISQYRLAKTIGVAPTRYDLDLALETNAAELDQIQPLIPA